jgi:hypothetical protein
MNKALFPRIVVGLCVISALLSGTVSYAQDRSEFWQRVQFGGSLGIGFGSGYTDVTVAPSAIYNFNQYFAAGVGLQGTYVDVKNYYSSFMYGGSLILLSQPLEFIQLSAELEQLRVNNSYDTFAGPAVEDDFWNTALYLGAGFRQGNFTVGVRYNVLFKEDKYAYSEAFMPFVRVYF